MEWKVQQLRKSANDRMLAGVCGGLGEYTPVPASAWRVMFILTAIFGCAGLVAYVLLWLLMPAADSEGASAGVGWNLEGLRRSSTDRQVEGVCGGLGEYTPIPAWLWRATFVGLIFAGGLGLVAYVVLWAVIPRNEPVITHT